MKYTLQQPGRSIYKPEQSSLKNFKFSIAGDYRTIEQGWTTYSFVFFSEKMVQSAAIKQGQLANRKHTYFFFFCLSGSYNISSQIKVSHLFNTGGHRVALSSAYF